MGTELTVAESRGVDLAEKTAGRSPRSYHYALGSLDLNVP